MNSSVEGLRSFGLFNESLNGHKIALNIMNEGKKFSNRKYQYLLQWIQFKIHSKNSKNSP
jgi:hypothetical protein